IHIMTKTKNQHLKMKTVTLIRLPSQKPTCHVVPRASKFKKLKNSVHSQGTPMLQPPRNISVAIPLTANMLPYSAMKITSQRKPEYSVWKPATSSLSASARSNGARLQLAKAHV